MVASVTDFVRNFVNAFGDIGSISNKVLGLAMFSQRVYKSNIIIQICSRNFLKI
jgi:hypothetical protein